MSKSKLSTYETKLLNSILDSISNLFNKVALKTKQVGKENDKTTVAIIDSSCYGTELPSKNCQEGQIFFLIQ